VGGPYFSVVTPLPRLAVAAAAAGDDGRPIPQYSFVRRADASPFVFLRTGQSLRTAKPVFWVTHDATPGRGRGIPVAMMC
jgi:hypothetical protein